MSTLAKKTKQGIIFYDFGRFYNTVFEDFDDWYLCVDHYIDGKNDQKTRALEMKKIHYATKGKKLYFRWSYQDSVLLSTLRPMTSDQFYCMVSAAAFENLNPNIGVQSAYYEAF